LCNLIVPLNASLPEAVCAVVLLVFKVPGAEGIVTAVPAAVICPYWSILIG
jgi:hypothetical protein